MGGEGNKFGFYLINFFFFGNVSFYANKEFHLFILINNRRNMNFCKINLAVFSFIFNLSDKKFLFDLDGPPKFFIKTFAHLSSPKSGGISLHFLKGKSS